MRAYWLLLFLLAAPGWAAEMVVPVSRGPVVSEIRSQMGPLVSGFEASGLSGLRAAFKESIVPAPQTPEGFAARSFLVEALASPNERLPQLADSLEAAGGKKARRAADSLRRLGAMIGSAPKAEARGLASEASALLKSFDGAAAAPGEVVPLSQYSTREKHLSKKKAEKLRRKEIDKLRVHQKQMYADGDQAVLVIMDGLDSAGKGRVIDAFKGLSPSWMRTEQVKKPTPEEFAQHYLERIRRMIPRKGENKIVFMDRSYYEDIFVPSVMSELHKRYPDKFPPAMFSDAEIESRYGQNVEFEREMAARGVKIVKIFLHMSRDVQRKRLQDRLDKPLKRWKSPPDKEGRISDLETRKEFAHWVRARQPVLARTSTWFASWTVIGADDKPVRDLKAVRLVRKVMDRMGLHFPAFPQLEGLKVPR